jgi:predicted dehydrogenase
MSHQMQERTTILKSTINVAVVGYGYWGPHMARNISQISGLNLAAIVDVSESRLAAASHLYPEVPGFSSLNETIHSTPLEAVVIATPTHTHHALTLEAIDSGLHAIVEKPLTTSVEQGAELVAAATNRSLVLMVDHTYVYSPAVNRMKQYVDDHYLGDLIYFDSTRLNLGLFQPDVSVLWDLAVHDLAILNYVTGRHPVAVSATGGRHQQAKHEAATFLTLYFDDMFFAHINVSWLSPMKIRRTVLSGSERTVLFDDMMPDERLRLHEAGVKQDESALLHYRLGDVHIPKLENSEALRTELEHFRDCINHKITPRTGAAKTLGIIATLESAQKSIDRRGATVQIADPQNEARPG